MGRNITILIDRFGERRAPACTYSRCMFSTKLHKNRPNGRKAHKGRLCRCVRHVDFRYKRRATRYKRLAHYDRQGTAAIQQRHYNFHTFHHIFVAVSGTPCEGVGPLNERKGCERSKAAQQCEARRHRSATLRSENQ
jgi:hypothetical protein